MSLSRFLLVMMILIRSKHRNKTRRKSARKVLLLKPLKYVPLRSKHQWRVPLHKIRLQVLHRKMWHSSSEESVLQSSVSETLPFDTTGIRPQLIKYTIDPDTFSNETREKAGQFLGHFITTDEIVNPYCMVMHVYENGKIVTDYMGVRDVSNCVLVVREDSLMFSNIRNCRNVPICTREKLRSEMMNTTLAYLKSSCS